MKPNAVKKCRFCKSKEGFGWGTNFVNMKGMPIRFNDELASSAKYAMFWCMKCGHTTVKKYPYKPDTKGASK